MNDDELRAACEDAWCRIVHAMSRDAFMSQHKIDKYDEKEIVYLMTFAKQMQAVGVRRAKGNMAALLAVEQASTDDQVYDHMNWCENEARRLEGK